MNVLDYLASEYIESYKEKKSIVSSKEYIDWLYDYVTENASVDDDNAMYVYEGIDSDNGLILGFFLDYVEELANVQRVLVVADNECMFDNEEVVVKIKDKYFKVFRMYGQGSWTCVSLLNEEPDYAYVRLNS